MLKIAPTKNAELNHCLLQLISIKKRRHCFVPRNDDVLRLDFKHELLIINDFNSRLMLKKIIDYET